jgi:ribonuclease HIII
MEANKSIQDFYDELKRVVVSFQLIANPLQLTDKGYGCRIFNTKHQSVFVLIVYKKKAIYTTVLDDDNPSLKDYIERLLKQLSNPLIELDELSPLLKKRKESYESLSMDRTNVVYICTYGEDKYFGPQIISAHHLNEEAYNYFSERGFSNWSHISKHEVLDISAHLKQLTKHALIRLGNESYNSVYEKMGNHHHILAWSISKIIENMKRQHDCSIFVIPPFDGSLLIQDLLLSKGLEVTIYHADPPEHLLGFQLGMCLAYDTFIEEIKRIEEITGLELPLINEQDMISVGLSIAKENGLKSLNKLTKFHFPLTDSIKRALEKEE